MSKSPKKDRMSNIELLRIFAIMGVIILHYNNSEIGGGIAFAEPKRINLYFLYLFESLSICAVDLFYMISGYFMTNSYERRIKKPMQLLIQVVLFNLLWYLISGIRHSDVITIKGIIGRMIPANYFVIFYCVIWFLSPYINKLMDVISVKESRKMIILLGAIFSVYCTIVQGASNFIGDQIIGLDSIGMYGSQNGYNIVNFMFVYMIGAYIRRYYDTKTTEIRKLLYMFMVNTAIITAWSILERELFQTLNATTTAWIYCNPLVILNAALLLMIFVKLDFGVNRLINWFSSGVFSVFLLHGYFITHIGIEKAVRSNVLLMIMHMVLSTICIFVICTIVDHCYKKISKPILDAILNRFDPEIVNLKDLS